MRKRWMLNLSPLPCPSVTPLQLALRFLEAWSTLAGFQRSTHAPAKYDRCMEAVLAHRLRWALLGGCCRGACWWGQRI
jgi:hypothetical protein